jgi:hypothetical protein
VKQLSCQVHPPGHTAMEADMRYNTGGPLAVLVYCCQGARSQRYHLAVANKETVGKAAEVLWLSSSWPQ